MRVPSVSPRPRRLMPWLVLILQSLTLVSPVLAADGLLDGRSFTGQTGPKGKAAEGPDTLIFEGGTMRSTGCDAYGFGAAPYVATREGDRIRFTATTTSPDEGKIEWTGSVRGDVLEGTFVWKKNLLIRRTYWIRASQQ